MGALGLTLLVQVAAAVDDTDSFASSVDVGEAESEDLAVWSRLVASEPELVVGHYRGDSRHRPTLPPVADWHVGGWVPTPDLLQRLDSLDAEIGLQLSSRWLAELSGVSREGQVPGPGVTGADEVVTLPSRQAPATAFLGEASFDVVSGTARWRGHAVDGSGFGAVFVVDGEFLTGWWETAEGTFEAHSSMDGEIFARLLRYPPGDACGVGMQVRPGSSNERGRRESTGWDLATPAPAHDEDRVLGALDDSAAVLPYVYPVLGASTSSRGAGDPIDVLVMVEKLPGTCPWFQPYLCDAEAAIEDFDTWFPGQSVSTVEQVAAMAVETMDFVVRETGSATGVRLLSIEDLPFNIANDVCVAASLLQEEAIVATAGTPGDYVRERRDTVGADVVIVLSGTPYGGFSGNGGCIGLDVPRDPGPGAAGAESRYIAVVKARTGIADFPVGGAPGLPGFEGPGAAGWQLYAHELGHLLGVAHQRSEFSVDPGVVPPLGWHPTVWESGAPVTGTPTALQATGQGAPYAFGTTACVQDGSGDTIFYDVMAKNLPPSFVDAADSSMWDSPAPECAGVASRAYSRFGDVGVDFPGTSIPSGAQSGLPVTVLPAGLQAAVPGWFATYSQRESSSARRVRETASELAAYREVNGILEPPVGADLGGGDWEFRWVNPLGSTDQFVVVIERWSPAESYVTPPLDTETCLVIFSGSVAPPQCAQECHCVSRAAAGLSVASSVLRVQLLLGVDHGNPQFPIMFGLFEERRYNTKERFAACSEDPEGLSGWDPLFSGASCGAMCFVGGAGGDVAACDLPGSTSSGADASVITRPAGLNSHYELAVFGEGGSGTPFCCLLDDPDEIVQRVDIDGSSGADLISLYDAGDRLYPWTASGELDVEVVGFDGADIIIGSNETAAGYREVLRGANGNDIVLGQEGNDLLNGGSGNDSLNGMAGADTVVGRTGVDTVAGGEGSDTVCERDLSSTLIGSPAGTPPVLEVNQLWYWPNASGSTPSAASAANGTISTCGHPDHGTTWGQNCSVHLLTQVPSACANEY